MVLVVGCLIVAAAVYMIARRHEVRLVLVLAALAMSLVAGVGAAVGGGGWSALANSPVPIIRAFVVTFSNEKFVVPICTAMGFAYTLRETGCDQHLVRLLTKPFERVRLLLVPGTVIVGFLVNIPLISQTSTAVAVGTVLVPLLRAARIPSLTIAAALVLGASLGGELLNKAAPELNSVADILRKKNPDADPGDCVARVLPLVWPHLLVATAVFWALSWWLDRRAISEEAKAVEPAADFRVNPIKAMVPFVPLLILFLTSSQVNLVTVPDEWLVMDVKSAAEKKAVPSRMIGAAMLIGVLAAAATTPRTFRQTAATFFEGAGYGFTHIISLIVVATCFGEGIRLIGLDAAVGRLMAGNPSLLIPLAAVIPLLFGLISGSGMAATQSLFGFYVDPIESAGADPFHVGAVVALGAAAGRTISPVAAVTLMSAKMTDTSPFAIARRVTLPILAGMVAVLIRAMI